MGKTSLSEYLKRKTSLKVKVRCSIGNLSLRYLTQGMMHLTDVCGCFLENFKILL